jgi:protein-tyrosine kinase
VSSVERMAELLGAQARAEAKTAAPAPAAGQGAAAPDLIERAVGELGAAPRRAEVPPVRADNRTAGERAMAGAGKGARRASRTVQVDLAHLRRQGVVTPDAPRTPTAESLRRVKRHVLAQAAQGTKGVPANLVQVTSSLAEEGKTFCAVNLAISIALEMDRTVLLVDADVARPSVPQVLGVQSGKGLMDLLLDRNIELSEVLCRTDIDKLAFLPAGTPHGRATELLASDAMGALVGELASRYRDRIVIFDSPPLLAASEAAVLAGHMGQILLVVEAGRTTEAALGQALGLVESGNVALVLNKGDDRGSGYGYGYGY